PAGLFIAEAGAVAFLVEGLLGRLKYVTPVAWLALLSVVGVSLAFVSLSFAGGWLIRSRLAHIGYRYIPTATAIIEFHEDLLRHHGGDCAKADADLSEALHKRYEVIATHNC